jgi:hypothetical protein
MSQPIHKRGEPLWLPGGVYIEWVTVKYPGSS